MVGPIEWVERGIVAPKHWRVCLAWALAAVAVPVMLRLAIDRGANGFPFATFLPAILWVSIFLDWRFATLSAAGSLVAAVAFFVEPVFLANPSWQRGVLFLLYLFTVSSMILTGHLLRRAVLGLEQRSRQAEAFNADLQHRARNGLQVVKALASRASRATDPAEFYKTLGGRIGTLIKANELLGIHKTSSCELKELVAAALSDFPSSRIAWSGPPCRVGREGGSPLMMALHELATNAAKHGALSNDTGRVAVEWQATDTGRELNLIWWESGGPPVEPPKSRGLGARILSPQGGLRRVDLEYDPAGLRCRLAVQGAP